MKETGFISADRLPVELVVEPVETLHFTNTQLKNNLLREINVEPCQHESQKSLREVYFVEQETV